MDDILYESTSISHVTIRYEMFLFGVLSICWLVALTWDHPISAWLDAHVERRRKTKAERKERERQEAEIRHQKREERRRRIIEENPDCVVCMDNKREEMMEWCYECNRATCLDCHFRFAFVNGYIQDCPFCRTRRSTVTNAELLLLDVLRRIPSARKAPFENVIMFTLGMMRDGDDD